VPFVERELAVAISANKAPGLDRFHRGTTATGS